jgi:thiamine-phosphate pyrophosphorylase
LLPLLYAIVDSSFFPNSEELCTFAESLRSGGVTLFQYRNKSADSRRVVDEARELKRRLGSSVRLIVNDRADVCLALDFDGVHVGQDDLSPAGARAVLGPDRWLGVSTHNHDQVVEADQTTADYIAIGPVFGTASKSNPDPVVGLEGVRRARALTRKPLVAIGGITLQNCRSVIDAGADSVAVISALYPGARKSAQDFFSLLR